MKQYVGDLLISKDIFKVSALESIELRTAGSCVGTKVCKVEKVT